MNRLRFGLLTAALAFRKPDTRFIAESEDDNVRSLVFFACPLSCRHVMSAKN